MTQRILSRVLGQAELEQVNGGVGLPTPGDLYLTKIPGKKVTADTEPPADL
ncbi:MAG: hypothetical protein JNM52_06830 [Betaproteobacteria bacterium]|nr:hypothetical protein [Betaproteobacteria bacterium]